MNKFRKIILMKLIVLILCLMSNVNQIFAQDSPNSQELIVPTNPSYVDEKDKDKLIQKILLDLSFEKEKNAWNIARIKQVESERDAALFSRDEWKALFASEQLAHNKSRESLFESKSETRELRTAIAGFQNQRDLDKIELSRKDFQIEKLKSSRLKWVLASLAVGGGLGIITARKF